LEKANKSRLRAKYTLVTGTAAEWNRRNK